MKRITAFIGSLGGGGAQGVFITVMNYYVNLGHEVDVVINTMSNDVHSTELHTSINITNLNSPSAKESLPQIIKYIKTNNIELAFAFSPEIAVNIIIARYISRKKFPIIGRCINTLSFEYKYAEGFFRRCVTNMLVKNLYCKADIVVAQAERMREDLIKNYKFNQENVITINNPLGEKFNREIDNAPNLERDNCILYVGRFEQQKGLNMLLEAFSMISDKEISLLLIGKGSQESNLQEKAKELEIEERLHILPFCNNIQEIYKAVRVTVMSSYFEGFPNVLSESIACGTPVVSFDLPSGPSDIIIEGVNGYLAEYLNVEDLADRISMALNTSWNYSVVKETAKRFRKDIILPQYNSLMEKLEAV